MTDLTNRKELLLNIPLFNFLTDEEFAELLPLFNDSTYLKGDTICKVGDVGDTAFVIVSGEIEVYGGPEQDELLTRFAPGTLCGEMALLMGDKRQATMKASMRTELLELTKDAFDRFFLNNAKTLEYFSKLICQRLAATSQRKEVGESRTSVAVLGKAGLKGKSLVATSLALLLRQFTGKELLCIQIEGDVGADGRRAKDLLEVSSESLMSDIHTGPDGTMRLKVGLPSGLGKAQYGERLSALTAKVGADFRYIIFDIGSQPAELLESVDQFSDVVVRLMDNKELSQDASQSGRVRFFRVLNLYNEGCTPVPINSCDPFVLPKDEVLAQRGPQKMPASPATVPLARLARKILGQTVGLALGGGAAFGISHLGVLKVMEENNIPIDLLAGCSIGSMVASGYAAGVSVSQLIEMAHELGQGSKLWKLLDPTMFLYKPSIIGGDNIKEIFAPYLGTRQRFEDLIWPLRLCATDIETGELVDIKEGRLEDGFRASSSVPVVIAPVREGERVLVDGGVVDPVPAELVRNMGADIVIAINVVPQLKRGVENSLTSFIRFINTINPLNYIGKGLGLPNTLDITMNSMQVLQHELGNFKAISADVRINPDLSDFTWIEFNRSHELIDCGIEAAERALPAIKKAVDSDS
jgi:NTE family protein